MLVKVVEINLEKEENEDEWRMVEGLGELGENKEEE